LFPILLEIPNFLTLPGSVIVAEALVGIVCLLAWVALRARGSQGWAVSLFSTGAILVVLHAALSWFMGKDQAITIYSFGVIVILAFLAAVWFMTSQTKRLGLPTQKIFDWGFWLLVTGIIGSRLLYAFLNYEEFQDDKLLIFKIWNGGLVWYGGLIPAVIVAVWLLHRYKLPVLTMCDVCSASLMLALGIGRWACLLAGDDYGARTDSWVGIRFYNPKALVPDALKGELLHPTQLYMSLNALWLFFVLELIRRRSRYAGTTFAAMLIGYAVTRAVLIEPVRGDFVERNPAYGKHVAAEVALTRREAGAEVVLPRGTVVASADGRKGELLADLRLAPDATHGSAWAISDAPAEPRKSPGLPFGRTDRRGAPPEWNISKVEGVPANVQITALNTIWYGSHLPKPPGYVSTSQWISVGIVLAGVLILLVSRRLREPGFSEAVSEHEAAAAPAV